MSQGGSVSQVTGFNRFSGAAPTPPERPKPDAITQRVLDSAKVEKIAAIAESKKVMDADAAKLKEALAQMQAEKEACKKSHTEAQRAELAADKAQKKLVTMRRNINTMKQSPEKGEVKKMASLQ